MAALPKHYLVSLGLKEIPRKTSVVWYDGHVSCKAINIHMERRESFKSHLTNWTHRIYVLIKQFVTKIKLKQQTIKLPIFAYTGFLNINLFTPKKCALLSTRNSLSYFLWEAAKNSPRVSGSVIS